MALLDELGRGLSGIGRKTAEMGRNFSDSSRLNSQIADEERNIQNCLMQIGRLYVELHSTDYESSFAVWMQNLADSEMRISEYKKQLQVLRGVRSCPNCGADVQKTASFCSVCGTRMPIEPPPVQETPAGSVFCSNCGAAMPRGTRFCTTCGTKLEQPAPAPAYPAAPAEAAKPSYDPEPAAPVNIPPVYTQEAAPETLQSGPEDPEPMNRVEEPVEPAAPIGRFCTNCGTKLQPDDLFCTECGTKCE